MAERDPEAPQTQAQKCRDWVEAHLPVWMPYRDAIDREEAFSEGDRYELDSGAGNRDRRLTQIRGQEIQDTLRHFSADATSKPRSVEAVPIDDEGDADLAEFEVALVDQELRDPWKGFESRYYEAIYDSRQLRLGMVWMDWEPKHPPYGELFPRTIDPRRVMWDECYDPHHPQCEVFVEQRRVPVKWVHANFKGSDWVQPDASWTDSKTRRLREGVPLRLQVNGNTLTPLSSQKDGKAELWWFWWKNDQSYSSRETGRDLNIPPPMRYMTCMEGCGFRSPTQSELGIRGKPQRLPVALEGGCPDCGGDLERIDAFSENEPVRQYPSGNRLTIIAPFSAAPDDRPVYDGKWPLPRLRSFPGLFLQAYLAPRKPMGKSDVSLMWDQQCASDNLATLALQRVYEHRSYWEIPKNIYTDFRGQRFTFRDDQFNYMFKDMAKAQQWGGEIKNHLASGLDWQGWQQAWAAVQDKLTRYRGVTDFGLNPDNTKQIAVGTVERLTQQGNIPLEEYNRRKNMELAKFYGVQSDAIHATYTPQRLTRLNIRGTQMALRFWGQDMPRFDFRIEETPDFTGLEKRRSEAFQAFLGLIPQAQVLSQTLMAPPGPVLMALIDIFANVTNLPRTTVNDFKRALKQATQLGAVNTGGDGEEDLNLPPSPEPMIPPEMARMGNGITASGMEPALAP